MSFKVDYSEAQDFSAVPDGDYEVVVFNVNEDATPSGAEHINFDLIIRNDIQQARQNSHLFHKIWKNKETGKYHRGMIMGLAKAFGLQDGKEYQSFDQFLRDFTARVAKVKVKNETSEYKGKTYENTNIKQFKPSEFQELQHQFKSKDESPDFSRNDQFEVPDSDLPF